MLNRIARSAAMRPMATMSVRSFAAAKKGAKGKKAAAAKAGGNAAAVPKNLFGVHGRYATALFVSASNANALDKVEAEVGNFVGHVNSNPQFASFLRNPTIPKNSKKADIEAILAKGSFSKTSVAFFGVLAENGRLGEVEKIAAKYTELMQAHRGEVAAVITSADALSAAQVKQLESSFASFLEPGQKITAEYRVDPEILGGLTVQIGDQFMDLSLSTKVNRMHKVLSDAL